MDNDISKTELALRHLKEGLADGKRASDAIEQAAAEGIAQAEYVLGILYYKGWEVPRDMAEAFKWFQRAAFQGVVGAQFAVGVMYRKGLGVKQDDEQSQTWLKRAATKGSHEAKKVLARPLKSKQIARRSTKHLEGGIYEVPRCKYCKKPIDDDFAGLGAFIFCKDCLWERIAKSFLGSAEA